METQRTFSILKPDAVKNQSAGAIIGKIHEAGFSIRAMKMTRISIEEAENFYSIHRGKEFFERLTRFMASGPIVVMVLEKYNAIEDYRKLLGPTDSTKAPKGTIRGDFGTTTTQNAAHGADSVDNAEQEWSFFFSDRELF